MENPIDGKVQSGATQDRTVARSPYKKNLLYLLHFLTLQKRLMNSEQIRKVMKYEGRPVAERTVRRWFDELKRFSFDYFLQVRFESLGLVPTSVIVYEPKDVEMLKAIPYLDYMSAYFDLGSWRNALVLRCIFPRPYQPRLREFLREARESGQLEGFEIHCHSTPVALYSPFHKVWGQDGKLQFGNVSDDDYAYYVEMLRQRLQARQKVELHPHIRKNPFIVPVVMEQFRRQWCSRKVWYAIKESLGENAWAYQRRVKKRTDWVGIRRVQETLKQIDSEDYDGLFQQVRVEYQPFYYDRNLMCYLVSDFRNEEAVMQFVQQLSRRCLSTHVFPSLKQGSGKTLIRFITDLFQLRTIMTEMMSAYTKSSDDNRLLVRLHEKSSEIWPRYSHHLRYQELFDPAKREWASPLFN